jgi:DNA modification methylase
MAKKPDNTRKLSADKIVLLPLAEIRPYDKNPRKNEKAVKYVKESIRQFGFKVPIVIDSNRVIVCGHTRLLAAKSLGMTEVPCIMADDLTDDQVKAFRLADNKVGEFAEWDLDLLNIELGELDAGSDIDMGLFGFDPLEPETPPVEEDEIPEDAEPIVKPGELWRLGEHRLMCGDATDPSTYDKLMDGKKADLVFTDPPYGMKKENEGIANDNLNFEDLLEFNKQWIPLTFQNLKENGSWYCWGIDEPLMDIYSNILKPMQKRNEITFRNLITWDKGDAGAGGVSFMGAAGLRSYPVSDEKCLFVMCGVEGFNNNLEHYNEAYEPIRAYLEAEAKKVGLNAKKLTELTGVQMFGHWFSKSQFTIIPENHYKKLQAAFDGRAFTMAYDDLKNLLDLEADGEHKSLRDAVMAKRAYFDNTHDKMKSVWEFPRTKGAERAECGGHATPKPLALCARAIKSSTRENETVLDVFGGSGSTLIACEQLKRKCFMVELDPHYCDVIIARWEKLTGEKAVKVEG